MLNDLGAMDTAQLVAAAGDTRGHRFHYRHRPRHTLELVLRYLRLRKGCHRYDALIVVNSEDQYLGCALNQGVDIRSVSYRA